MKMLELGRSGAVLLVASILLLVGSGGLAAAAAPGAAATSAQDSEALARLEARLELLREALRIPGLSAAVVQDEELLWAQGFGHADQEHEIEATAETPYGLASVTKPFAAILLMKLVEEERLDLDAPASDFGIDLGNPEITVRHLLSHTSEGIPGSRYQYSGDRYSRLTVVLDQLYGAPFRRTLRREILEPLGMSDTALNNGSCGLEYYVSTLATDDPEQDFLHVYQEIATPYQYDPDFGVYPVGQPSYANAAAGLISTVVDLARFAIALDRDVLVLPETKEQMFTPTRLVSGDEGPYGLGWFTEIRGDTRLVWHYGYGAYSSLFLTMPDEGLAFIVLANTQNLSRPFQLGMEGVSVLASPFALEFFKEFFLQPVVDEPLPRIDWAADEDVVVEQIEQISDPELREVYGQELWAYRKLYGGVGRSDVAARLVEVHKQAFPGFERSPRDLFQAGRPGPRPTAPPRVELTDEQAARWVGRYVLRSADPEQFLPPEVEARVIGGRIIAVPTEGECLGFLPQSPTRLVSSDNPTLFFVADAGEGPIQSAYAEIGGTRVGTYERVD